MDVHNHVDMVVFFSAASSIAAHMAHLSFFLSVLRLTHDRRESGKITVTESNFNVKFLSSLHCLRVIFSKSWERQVHMLYIEKVHQMAF